MRQIAKKVTTALHSALVSQLPWTVLSTQHLNSLCSNRVEFYITTDCQSASVSWCQAPIWGLRPDFYYCYGFADVGRFLWREEGSIVYICCWTLINQSFSGPSPVGFATIFYCLIFETSLSVAFYDSQGYSGGIRHRLRTGYSLCQSQSQSDVTTDGSVGQSVLE
jgi:hypothetical protein